MKRDSQKGNGPVAFQEKVNIHLNAQDTFLHNKFDFFIVSEVGYLIDSMIFQ